MTESRLQWEIPAVLSSLFFCLQLNGIIPLGNWVWACCPRQGWLGRLVGWLFVCLFEEAVQSVSQSVRYRTLVPRKRHLELHHLLSIHAHVVFEGVSL